MPNLQPLRILGFCLLAMGCSEESPWSVDPDGVSMPAVPPSAALHRLVAALPTDDAEALGQFREAAGPFAAAYTEAILGLGPANAPATAAELRRFAAHESIAPSLGAIDSTSGAPDRLADAERELDRAFRRFHHHFPDAPVPRLYWIHSGFNYAVYPTDSALAIGLEWFLGPDHPIVESLAPSIFPAYMKARMHPDMMAADALRGWLLVHFSDPWYAPEQCADAVLFWGKVLFILNELLPETPDADWMDWTAESWAWAEAHEREIWLELSRQDQIYNAHPLEFIRWFNEGPFTRAANLPQDSPDRLGAWMGYRIVSAYMADHPEVSLAELMEMTDPLPFLKAYR